MHLVAYTAMVSYTWTVYFFFSNFSDYISSSFVNKKKTITHYFFSLFLKIMYPVKPANILITSSGDFILADLGSIVRVDQRSASTRAYLPREMWVEGRPPLASPHVDWWMLAMTIYEKVCGGEIGGSTEPTKEDVKKRLTGAAGGVVSNIPQDILNILIPNLD